MCCSFLEHFLTHVFKSAIQTKFQVLLSWPDSGHRQDTSPADGLQGERGQSQGCGCGDSSSTSQRQRLNFHMDAQYLTGLTVGEQDIKTLSMKTEEAKC